MFRRKFFTLTRQMLAPALVILGTSLGFHALAQNGGGQKAKDKGKVTRDQVYVEKFKRIAPSEQKKAAQLAAKRGLKPGIAGLTAIGTAAASGTRPRRSAALFRALRQLGVQPAPEGSRRDRHRRGRRHGVQRYAYGHHRRCVPTGGERSPPLTVTATVDGWRHYRLHDRQRRRRVHGSRRHHH